MQTQARSVLRGYATTEQGQIHYAEVGSGAPLVLLSETPRTYRYFLRIMPLLAEHFHVIAMDTPGFGNSHDLPKPTTIPALAKCVAALLDALGLERASVLGVHTGDKTAAAFAAEYPSRIDKLILAGQSHSLIPDLEERKQALMPSLKHYHPLEDANAPPELAMFKRWTAAQATVAELWWSGKLLTKTATAAFDIENAERSVADYVLGWRSPVAIYEAVFAFDLTAAVKNIQASTLVLEFLSPEEEQIKGQAERLCKFMKAATAATLPVTYLAAFQHQPQEIADVVSDFLLANN